MGNGAKAQQKRERNADKNSGKKNTSQKDLNEQKKNVICQVCKQAFFTTVRRPELEQHSSNKHSKTFGECFPNYTGS